MTFQAQTFSHYTSTDYPPSPIFSSAAHWDQHQAYTHRAMPVSESYIHTSEVVIIEPQSFSEVPSAVQILRNNKVVVLNLAHMANAEAQRSIDFIAGSAYMCQGSLEKIDVNIFLLTPYSTNIRVEASQTQAMPNLDQESQMHNRQPNFSNGTHHHSFTYQAS
ncbi:MAG: hypothetical protein RLZZ597_613 [Cyanobacteriota bacterium]|jgi:FtsZ-interacting cell division protein YlmF